MAKGKTVPVCVGRYEEEDVECNGGPGEKSCAWRDKCGAFASYLLQVGSTPEERQLKLEEHVKLIIRHEQDDEGRPVLDRDGEPVVKEAYGRARKGQEQFSKFCDRLVEAFGVKEGLPTKEVEDVESLEKEPAEKMEGKGTADRNARKKKTKKDAKPKTSSAKPKPKTKKKTEPAPKPKADPSTEPKTEKGKPGQNQLGKKRPPYKRVQERARRMFDFFKFFLETLSNSLPEGRLVDGKKVAIPGQFYIVDRRKSGNYLCLYCRTAIGRDLPVARVLLKPLSETVNVQIPVESKVLRKVMGKKNEGDLGPHVPVKSGKFKTELQGLDREMVTQLAEYLNKMVEGGELGLPEM